MNAASTKFRIYLVSCLPLVLSLVVWCASCAQASDTVVGCGGFIRWSSSNVKEKIDYQKLKVNLYHEESGSLKDVTEVLPNGAFSVPLYDQGPYRLRLSTPKGWHVSPANGYPLDLRNNPKACANDFNFEILGFTVSGQVVTYGLNKGPAGLLVRLISTNGLPEVRTHTQIDGHFTLEPVVPGDYILTVSESGQAVSEHVKARSTVFVRSDSVLLNDPIVLLGHFVRGHIADFTGKALPGVTVYLATSSSSANIDCTRVPEDKSKAVQLSSNLTASHHVVCETITDSSGQFSFNRLPGGEYAMVPWYSLDLGDSTPPIAFAFDPPLVHVSVEHMDVVLGSGTFSATSFQLAPGRVTWPNGQPIGGAKISFGDKMKPVLSDSKGFYQVGFIKPQRYTIHVELTNAEFSDHTVHLSPNTKQLPGFQPNKLSLCGRLESKEDLSKVADKLEAFVQVTHPKSGSVVRTAAALRGSALRFCVSLAPGQYELSPDVRIGGASAPQVYFAPVTQTVELSAGPVSDVVFSQFTAKLAGRVTCLVSCSTDAGQLVVQLSPVNNKNNNLASDVLHGSLNFHKGAPSVGYFTFENIFPGDYSISVVYQTMDSVSPVDGWCWEHVPGHALDPMTSSSSRVIQVRHADLDWKTDPSLNFVQSGFAIRIQSVPPSSVNSLPPDVFLKAASQPDPTKNGTKSTAFYWTLNKRTAKICLPSAETVYELSVSSSCVKLNPPSISRIHPVKDCAPVLASCPLVRLTASQLPLLIQLEYEQAFEPTDRALLTKAPIRVDVTQPADGTGQPTAKVSKILARWSAPDAAHSPPVAQALLWIDRKQSVLVKPKLASVHPDRWFFTHMATTDSLTLNMQHSEEDNDLTNDEPVEFHFISAASKPPQTMNQNPPTNPKEFTACAHLYENQTARFGVRLAVSLRGETQPAVKKAEVRLLIKSTKPIEDPSLTADEPLLPIHPTDSDQTDSTNTTVAMDQTASSSLEVTITDVDGTFLFGPVPVEPQPVPNSPLYRLPDPADVFTIAIHKPGYEFALQPVRSAPNQNAPSNWVFKATKLSLVEVLVRSAESDEHGAAVDSRKPLQGVLVSIIGEGHRGNQFTDKSGLAHFVGLAPGQYYLRPMMKEYTFTVVKPKAEQSGQASPVTVSEGVSVHVEVVAKRIAFSVSGTVTSLAKLPEPDVLVEAEWIPSLDRNQQLMRFVSAPNTTCQLKAEDTSTVPKEQAWTDTTGVFQIRGLLPGCFYAVAVHTSAAYSHGDQTSRGSVALSQTAVERAIPAVVHIVMAPHDVSGLSFIAIRPFYMSTLTVSVDTADEFLPSLRLSLFPLDRPDLVAVTHDFSVDSLLFQLTGPKLASIVGQDHVLRLESTLDPTFYTNIASQDMVIRPKPDRSEHLQFTFRPKLRSSYPESTSRTEL